MAKKVPHASVTQLKEKAVRTEQAGDELVRAPEQPKTCPACGHSPTDGNLGDCEFCRAQRLHGDHGNLLPGLPIIGITVLAIFVIVGLLIAALRLIL